jgi:hypothetical protein
MKLKQRLLNAGRSVSGLFRRARLLPPFCYLAPAWMGRITKGSLFAMSWKSSPGRTSPNSPQEAEDNKLQRYFEAHREGRGIWKYQHYFPIYERHFRKFVGREVHVLEIGVYSGGSLEMWKSYFGPNARIYGVDVEESCRSYENEHTHIEIGDQADPAFWSLFRKRYPRIDIVIDDGGHRLEQQRVTFEAMLPHLQPGGVYLCEDLAGERNSFVAYLQGFAAELNRFQWNAADEVSVTPSALQRELSSIHFYPYIAVVEKYERPLQTIAAPKRGTQWQPFFEQ